MPGPCTDRWNSPSRAVDVLLEELRYALIVAQATAYTAQAWFAHILAMFRSRDGQTLGSSFPTFVHWASVDVGLSCAQTGSLADAGNTARGCSAPRVNLAGEVQ